MNQNEELLKIIIELLEWMHDNKDLSKQSATNVTNDLSYKQLSVSSARVHETISYFRQYLCVFIAINSYLIIVGFGESSNIMFNSTSILWTKTATHSTLLIVTFCLVCVLLQFGNS